MKAYNFHDIIVLAESDSEAREKAERALQPGRKWLAHPWNHEQPKPDIRVHTIENGVIRIDSIERTL